MLEMTALKIQKPRRILVAVDISEYASTVAEEAARLAPLSGSDVTLVSVVKMPALTASEDTIDSKELGEEEKELQSLHRSLIDKYFNHSSILIESKVLHGDPAEKICEYAETLDAGLVIVGTRGRGRITSAVLGSVSEKVARDCKRSVLIVKKHVNADR